MRSIAFMNQKGGTGKTTTAVNVSAALASTGAKVCLVDLDPQAHATLHFGILPQEQFTSIYDVLVDDKKLSDVRQKVAENLWLIPSHLDLSSAELELAGVFGRELILRDRFASDDMKFDYILVDCPPSLGVLTINALTAVEELIIPMLAQYLPLHGMIKISDTLNLVTKRLNNKLKLTGVVLCIFDGHVRLASEVAEQVDQICTKIYGQPKTFQTKIRRNIRLAEAPSHGETIFAYDPNSNGAEDYRALASEIHGQAISKIVPAK